jgi:hypothetical protein
MPSSIFVPFHPDRAIKLEIFVTAKEAKTAKIPYPNAFIRLMVINRFGRKLKTPSEPLSFFAHFASFAVKSKFFALSSPSLIALFTQTLEKDVRHPFPGLISRRLSK